MEKMTIRMKLKVYVNILISRELIRSILIILTLYPNG